MAKKKNDANIVVAATEQSLRTLPIGGDASTKLLGAGGEVRRDGAVTLVEGRGYQAGGDVIVGAAVYFDPEKRSRADGPWRGEADKIAWRDEETGLECIIMRDGVSGHLSGYVGVGPGHPLYGYAREALPNDVGIDVHGDITYARVCDEEPSPTRRVLREARSICHTVLTRIEADVVNATDHRAEAHQWWFGFSCNHVYDLKPGVNAHGAAWAVSPEIGAIYRDDAYVLNEVRNLARQLKAIASDEPMPARTGTRPPIALDPARRS